LPLRELLAFVEGHASTFSALPDRLVAQAPIRIAQDAFPPRMAGFFVFAFHDREEIGPRMLARIAKRTGLKPEDL
jgi:hypothetical protein